VDRFDVIIIGMGPGGETAAERLLAAGRRVAVVERELIGGECAYWACMPSKTLLRAPEARAEAARGASYHGIPRVIFGDPEIAATGYTTGQARARGIDVVTAEVALADAIARPFTYECDPGGTFGLLADRQRGVLAWAWAVAPLASEWIHQAALAIRAQIPIGTLLDQVAQFPTYSEAYLAALEQLRL